MQPTNARRTVTVFAVALAVVTYVDRVCIAQAAPALRRDLGLSAIEMGWAFTVFTWAYALFEVPGGWLGDRLGARRVLMRIVLWWSFFTAATGWVWNLTSLLITRTLFGAGEAGAFPNITRAFTTWLPSRERERAQAVLWFSARWGGAFTPLLVAYILDLVSWRRAFEIFGALGIVWAVVFYRWYRDDPATHPAVNTAELAIIPPHDETAVVHGATPWRTLLTSPSVLLLWAQYFCFSYGWWFYVTWLPTYLLDVRHLGRQTGRAARVAAAPVRRHRLFRVQLVVEATLASSRRRANAASARRDCAGRRRGDNPDVHACRGSDPGDGGARPRRLPGRRRHAASMDGVHGSGRALCGDRLRRHEHGGRHRRRSVAAGRSATWSPPPVRTGW
jgi:MFS family permease